MHRLFGKRGSLKTRMVFTKDWANVKSFMYKQKKGAHDVWVVRIDSKDLTQNTYSMLGTLNWDHLTREEVIALKAVWEEAQQRLKEEGERDGVRIGVLRYV